MHYIDCKSHCTSIYIELISIVTGLLIRAVEMLCAVVLTYNNVSLM